MASISIHDLPEYDDHKIVSTILDRDTHLHGYIAIHRGGLQKPSFGASRLWHYASNLEALRDALKLSRIMTYKSALAGLPYGGAKAVIMPPPEHIDHTKFLKAYAQRVNYLGGHFVTGADVGISPTDLVIMKKHSKFMVGSHVDPVAYTMLGVFFGINVAIKELFGTDDLMNRSFAIQGVGKTGLGLLQLVYKKAKKIYASDINADALKRMQQHYPNVEVVKPDDLVKLKVDVFSPCAMSNSINSSTIRSLRCSIVAGSANSQLESDSMGEKLHKMGILYAPDYVINAGGLMAVVDEYNTKKPDAVRITNKVRAITKTLRKILDRSKRTNTAMNIIADNMARTISKSFV